MNKDKCVNCETEDEHYLCCVDEIGDTVKRMVRNFQMIERDRIKPLGFTMTQCYCLIELLNHDDITMQELSSNMNLNTSTMTRIVDKLVRDHYIQRTRNTTDRRIVMVSLTETGTESAKAVQSNINSYYGDITKHLPKDKIDEVLDAVSLLMDAFEISNPNCC